MKIDYRGTIWIVASLSLLTIIGVAYFLFSRDFGGVILNIEASEPARIGEPFEIAVTLENKTSREISEASVSLSLPHGVVFADKRGDVRRVAELKTIPAGAFGREIFIVTITEFSEDKIFTTEAEYLPALLGRRIRESKNLQVQVQKWLSLDIAAPRKVISGERFEWELVFKNDTDKDLDLYLELELPEELISDTPKDRLKIAARENKLETFTASIVMEEGSAFKIKAVARGRVGDQEYILDDAVVEIIIAPSPLSLSVVSMRRAREPVHLGEEIEYVISFRNNSGISKRDIKLEAELEGAMFNVPSRTLIWTSADIPEFAEVRPGQSLSVNFSAKIADVYQIASLSDRDFVVKVRARIESPTTLEAPQSAKTINIASIKHQVIGRVNVSAKALYRDAASMIINAGVFPPVVGQFTEYSIHWEVISYSTDASGVEVSAEIPPGVEFVRQVRVDAGELVFDAERNMVIWNIPKILATTGVLSRPISIVFQVKATPTQDHLGSYMPILGPTNITARDNFTGTILTTFQEFITTALVGDSTVKPGEGIVRQSF